MSSCHRLPLRLKFTVASSDGSEERTSFLGPGGPCVAVIAAVTQECKSPLAIWLWGHREECCAQMVRAIKTLGTECRSADTDSVSGPPFVLPSGYFR